MDDGNNNANSENVARCVASIEKLQELLEQPFLQPGVERTDWPSHLSKVDKVRECLRSEILDILADATAELESEEDRKTLQAQAGVLCVRSAVLLVASGSVSEGTSLLHKALSLLADEESRAEVAVGLKDPKSYARLMHARWLLGRGEVNHATQEAKKVLETCSERLLKNKAQELLDAPKPLTSAPTLFRFNGFGLGLYGARDHRNDGSYVSTYCISALWLPVFPLSAYRVIPQDSNSYLFLAKEPLSSFAKGYRRLVVVGILAAVAVFGGESYLNSTSRQASLALEQAQELEAAGKRRAAVVALETLVRKHGDESNSSVEVAVADLVRLYCAEVPDPITSTAVDQAVRVVHRYRALPRKARGRRAAELLRGKLESWSSQLGSGTPTAARGALRLLKLAEELPGTDAQLTGKRQALQLSLAASTEKQWPLFALELYLGCEQPDALRRAGDLLAQLVEHPWLLLDAEALAEAWLNKAAGSEHAAQIAKVKTALVQARDAANAPGVKQMLARGDPRTLSKLAHSRPGDQRVAVALAELQQDRGQLDRAMATLTALGAPGWTTREAQQLRASLHSQRNELQEAEALLDTYVAMRMPAAQAAQRAFSGRVEKLQNDLVNRARRGDIPDDLHGKLRAAGEKEQAEIFSRWLTTQIDKDEKVQRLKVEYAAYHDVAPACLSLGMIKLRRAREASSEEQQRLLAQAEQLFLAIREEAEGLPTFHLGLGQVLYRLGRREDGEKEFRAVLEHGSAELEIAVAGAYRELGMVERAREVAEKVWKDGGEARQSAAVLLALMSHELAEKEKWLRRSDPSSPFIKTNLMEVRAKRLMQEGRLAEADRLMANVAKEYGREAAHNPSSANNAAIAEQSRFLCSGDISRLAAASEGLESALRMAPDNGLVLGNLATSLAYYGSVRVLSRWLDVKILKPSRGDVDILLAALASGPLRDQVVEALRVDASLRRSAELTEQEEILAPTRPDPYQREFDWYALREDVAALTKLHKRLQSIDTLDNSNGAKQREAYQRGTQDEQWLTEINSALARLEQALREAERRRRASTVAAARLMQSHYLLRRAELQQRAADAEAAVDACREAGQTWRNIGAQETLAWVLVHTALMKAATESQELAAKWKKEIRKYSPSMFLLRLSGNELGAVLQQRELAEAVGLRNAATDTLDLDDWVLGHVTEDATLEKKAMSAFTRRYEKLRHEIRARLDPSANTEAVLRVLQTHTKK